MGKSTHIQNLLREQILSKKAVLAAILIAAVCAAVAVVYWPADSMSRSAGAAC
jgi:cell division protein FtsL